MRLVVYELRRVRVNRDPIWPLLVSVNIHNGSAMAAEVALAEAKRARDDAVRSICELAQSLALLHEAITRADGETHRRLWAAYTGAAVSEPNR